MRVVLAVVEIYGARAERIVGSAVHAVLVLAIVLRLALLHVERSGPGRPFLLVAALDAAFELQPVAADGDRVAPSRRAILDEVEELGAGIDDDRAGRIAG